MRAVVECWWVCADPYNPIVQMLRGVTEPLYRLVRPLTSKIPGPLDWSPLVILILFGFLHRLAVSAIVQMP